MTKGKGIVRVAVVGDKEWRQSLPRRREKMGALMERAVLRNLIRVEAATKDRLNNKVLRRRTSTLFKSIHHQMHAQGLSSWGAVGTPIEYAAPNEEGAAIKNGFGRGIRIKIPARPFLRPSLDENEGRIVRDINRALAQGAK